MIENSPTGEISSLHAKNNKCMCKFLKNEIKYPNGKTFNLSKNILFFKVYFSANTVYKK